MKIKVVSGDIFRFEVSDRLFGYGQVLHSNSLQYIVVFEPEFCGNYPVEKIVTSPPLLSGWTSDALFYHGRWHIVANMALFQSVIFPNYKVEFDKETWVTDFHGKLLRLATQGESTSLEFKGSESPISYEKAFKAHHGRLTWQPWYEGLRAKIRTN
jgi:Immunity protein 26